MGEIVGIRSVRVTYLRALCSGVHTALLPPSDDAVKVHMDGWSTWQVGSDEWVPKLRAHDPLLIVCMRRTPCALLQTATRFAPCGERMAQQERGCECGCEQPEAVCSVERLCVTGAAKGANIG